MKNTKVISVGGSIIAPDQPDARFVSEFIAMLAEWLERDKNGELILIAGGGGPARSYQAAYRAIEQDLDSRLPGRVNVATTEEEEFRADLLGIAATRINAELLRAGLGKYVEYPVLTNPTVAPDNFHGRVLVASGWKPGFSSDFDAVILAEKYGAKTVINLSNIEKVYSDDPKKNPVAVPLDHVSWKDFRKMVGATWRPGLNAPFDPIASARAEMIGLTVICAAGRDIENTRAILNGEIFVGTTISG